VLRTGRRGSGCRCWWPTAHEDGPFCPYRLIPA